MPLSPTKSSSAFENQARRRFQVSLCRVLFRQELGLPCNARDKIRHASAVDPPRLSPVGVKNAPQGRSGCCVQFTAIHLAGSARHRKLPSSTTPDGARRRGSRRNPVIPHSALTAGTSNPNGRFSTKRTPPAALVRDSPHSVRQTARRSGRQAVDNASTWPVGFRRAFHPFDARALGEFHGSVAR